MAVILTPRGAGNAAMPLPAPLRRSTGRIVIGRDAAADLVIPDALVSARHCTLVGNGPAWQVQDSSTNGTTLNGQRIPGTAALQHGDVLGIGLVEIAVAIDTGADTQPSVPPGATTGINLQDWGRGSAAARAPAASAAPPAQATGAVTLLLRAAGIDRGAIQADDEAILAAAGSALRATTTGLAAMLADRRKARRELRLPAEPPSANPLKTGEAAPLEALLSAPPSAAAEMAADACRELDRHQRATLQAMQDAFSAALDQFAPEAIKLRARDDAAAWRAYEKAFAGADGFVDVFAAALAGAYDRLSKE
ncbi:FHA domain-containing protein [Sphingomonas parva]|uniref:FHA domain-containing protein n=1 Tax=Sphingomonas parva TaxID=2555898 RepID=A0A4Y8ZQ70_9SPHN|nr:FHA domain-containing protein [Sphingomonas parva]TFI57617.1 FHA domain-containing protein [Sphingomonas parva]